jgi:hypothetical protein
VIVGNGAGRVTVGSGTGRLGSPLGVGVVGAAVVDTGDEVLLADEVGESLAEGEPLCEPPALGVDLGLDAPPVADRRMAEPEPAIEPAAERAADGDGRYSPRDAAPPPPAWRRAPVAGATCNVVVPGPGPATDRSAVPAPRAGRSASRRGAAVRLTAATAPPTAIGAATRPMRRGRPVRRWRGARRARLTGTPRTMTGIHVMILESPWVGQMHHTGHDLPRSPGRAAGG